MLEASGIYLDHRGLSRTLEPSPCESSHLFLSFFLFLPQPLTNILGRILPSSPEDCKEGTLSSSLLAGLTQLLRRKQGPQQWGIRGGPARGPHLFNIWLPLSPDPENHSPSGVSSLTPSQSSSARAGVQGGWTVVGRATSSFCTRHQAPGAGLEAAVGELRKMEALGVSGTP